MQTRVFLPENDLICANFFFNLNANPDKKILMINPIGAGEIFLEGYFSMKKGSGDSKFLGFS